MKIKDIVRLVDGSIVCGEANLDLEVNVAFSSDLMSDVLTIKSENLLLITGLVNVQTIRTAEMSDICCLLFTRNKIVTPEMQAIACENEMVLITTPYTSFKTSGILFSNGLKPVY